MMLSDGDLTTRAMGIPSLDRSRRTSASFTDLVSSLGALQPQSFRTRRAIKAVLDFTSGFGATFLGIAVGQGVPTVGLTATLVTSAAIGALFVTVIALSAKYRAIWRYTGSRVGKGVSLASAWVLVVLFMSKATGVLPLSWATILLVSLGALTAAMGVRTLRRWQMAALKRQQPLEFAATRSRVLIVGAGTHGLSIGRELLEAASSGVELVGFLDDDPTKIGAALGDATVLGPLSQVLEVAEREAVDEVIVAMPDASPVVVREFVRKVEDAGLRVRAIRGVNRFVAGGQLHEPGVATHAELMDGDWNPPRVRRLPVTRRVLVTGGAGYIGSHLCRMLLEEGYHVRALDRLDYGRHGIDDLLEDPRFELIVGDICSIRDVSRALRDVEGVLALAAIVGDPACNLDPDETVNLNYAATKILVDACNFYGVPRLVFASSCSVYGASSSGAYLTERSRLNPVSLYARTRILSENILFDRRGDVEPVVLRLATVFGLSPRMRFDLVVNTLTVRAVVDGKIRIFGGGQWRPLVHCRDVAEAFIRAFQAPASAVSGEIFNVGGDELNHRITEIGDIVADIVPGVEILRDADAGDSRNYRVSFEKIRTVLGFEPTHTVAAGVEEIAAAVKADQALRAYREYMFHNVHALKESLVRPRRRREDFTTPAHLARA